MTAPRQVSLIANPSARGGHARKVMPLVCAELDRLGIPYQATFTRDLDHARELARAAATSGQIAAALGGDGLVAAVAGAMIGTGGLLAVLPAGRGNDFARSLDLPIDPIAACQAISSGVPRAVDVGVATTIAGAEDNADALAEAPQQRFFIGIAICGLDADTNRLANETKLPLGGLIYITSALRVLARWRPLRFDLKLDGEPRQITGYAVSIANSTTYGGGMKLAPHAVMDDGHFDVVMIRDVPRLRLLTWLPLIFFGRHLSAHFLEIARAETIELSTDRPATMFADGEELLPLPARVTIVRKAIEVLVAR